MDGWRVRHVAVRASPSFLSSPCKLEEADQLLFCRLLDVLLGRDAYPITVLLPTPLAADQSVTLTAALTTTHHSHARPAEIAQTDDQFLVWRGDAGVQSRYETDVARIKIRCVPRAGAP